MYSHRAAELKHTVRLYFVFIILKLHCRLGRDICCLQSAFTYVIDNTYVEVRGHCRFGGLDVGLPVLIVYFFKSDLYEECIEGMGDKLMPCLWSQTLYWIIYYCIVLAILLLDRSFYTTILLLPMKKMSLQQS